MKNKAARQKGTENKKGMRAGNKEQKHEELTVADEIGQTRQND